MPSSRREDDDRIAVDELTPIAQAIEQHGGRLLSKEVSIPNVGRLFQFADTEGNVACAMRYDEGADSVG